jgi:hypothetical protein
MRRLLTDPPKGFKLDALNPVIRTTISVSTDYKPFDKSSDGTPFVCPVCGKDIEADRVSTALSLECEGGDGFDCMVWAHQKCVELCAPTDEPDIEM